MNLENINLLLFFIFVLPGLISIKVYRLILPSKDIEWTTALIEGLFFSSITLLLLFPIVYPILYVWDWSNFAKILSASLLVLIASVGLPILLKFLLTKTVLSDKLNLPYPTSWDYFFDSGAPCFLLIHLKNDKLIGGYFGSSSYATTFPNQGDVYLEAVYTINDDRTFGEEVPSSLGLLITKEQYKYIEILKPGESQ